jgi:hypothetical protein
MYILPSTTFVAFRGLACCVAFHWQPFIGWVSSRFLLLCPTIQGKYSHQARRARRCTQLPRDNSHRSTRQLPVPRIPADPDPSARWVVMHEWLVLANSNCFWGASYSVTQSSAHLLNDAGLVWDYNVRFKAKLLDVKVMELSDSICSRLLS